MIIYYVSNNNEKKNKLADDANLPLGATLHHLFIQPIPRVTKSLILSVP